MDKVFLATDVLVAAEDVSAGAKARAAQELVLGHLSAGTGVISTQVLQEYFVVATRKIGVVSEVARRKIELFTGFEVVGVTVPLLLSAVGLHRLRGLSLWDALVVRAAAVAGCKTLLSEDLSAGRNIEGVRVVNPFV